jgi:LmbE family N-acetylglucosaminyl deacetylase
VVDLALLLRQLDGEKRVLMIAAHPDDEDTALLATLARGMGARTAYLSSRGARGGRT